MIGQRDLCVIFPSSMTLKPTTIVQQLIIVVCSGVTWNLTGMLGETASWRPVFGVSVQKMFISLIFRFWR